MHPLPIFNLFWAVLTTLLANPGPIHPKPVETLISREELVKAAKAAAMTCNCTITQDGISYPISALIGNETAVAFYSYGIPNGSSANTGLEESNGLILFLYEDMNTGLISLFLIADIANDGSGGTMTFELNCIPPNAYISVQDDPGEFSGSPPLITGNWSWSDCCTDGGVIDDVGCNNTMNLDLLLSTGIDSIVWLTGDIADPDHILLSLNGEAITINCGGGICCPIGFDTGINITNATCPDSPNGSIDVSPQDGTPPYSYSWSGGETTNMISGLLPATYSVTITDIQGCSEELQITVDVSPGDPQAQSASIQLCSENITDFFDLTSVQGIVNMGTGFNVLWFQNADMTGAIGSPSNYLSGTATVYAFVDNGSCLSDPVPVDLQILAEPIANASSMHLCEETNGMAIFDLTTLDNTVSGGSGNVLWYHDQALTTPVSDPISFYTGSVTIYAIVNDGTCDSEPVEIALTVDPKPIGYSDHTNLCGDDSNEAIFDLTLLDQSVSGGNGTVSWYLEMDLFDPINAPFAFQTTSTTVYAFVFDGVCYSDPIPVFLTVDPTPIGNPITAELCANGAGEALFNLWDYASQVSGGVGGVNWFLDAFLIDPVPDPAAFLTESIIIYAVVDNGICLSEPVPVNLVVDDSPLGHASSISTCADSTGQGLFNLTNADIEVSGGIGTVSWFEDAQGFFIISQPAAYLSSGSTVYAQVNDGMCLSLFVPVNLQITNSVSATPAHYEICDNGTGISVFNLLNIEGAISSGSGQVHWYLDSLGTLILPVPDSFPSGDTTVYADVMAGSCISNIVPVDLMLIQSPSASGMTLEICGDTIGEVIFDLTTLDTLVNGGMGSVSWFGDSSLSMSIPDPSLFSTGDTNVYALVSIGGCTSPVAEITFSISAELSGNPLVLQYCIPQGDTLMTDLTQSDIAIGGGSGQVNWFTDSLGTISLLSPNSFPLTTSEILYADVTDGVCVSKIVPIQLMVITSPTANPFTIKKCGDINGQATFDLSSVDPIVSGNTGIVTWYADAAQNIVINNAATFFSGDSIVYAFVTNGFCVSPLVPVILDVVDSLTANPISLQICVMDNDTAVIDLSQSDFDISGGNGNVIWFTDNPGTDTIKDPTAFVTTGATVFAQVEAGGCTSELATITIEVASSAFPLPVCSFSSIDSLAVSWPPVAADYELSYTINGQMTSGPITSSSTIFGIGGLGQGDTLMLSVTALFDSICTTPLTTSISCITDVCPAQTLSFPGLQSGYCRDEPYILINTIPHGGQLSGQGISGDTLYPNLVSGQSTTVLYTWQDNITGCVYDLSAQVQIDDPLSAPALTCQPSSLSSVTFDWTAGASQYGYEYAINQGAGSGVLLTGNSSLVINNLNEGDEVTFAIWSVGAAPCGNSDTVTATCITKQCPQAILTITDPGNICSNDDPFMMNVLITGNPGNPTITWTGQGISNPSGIFNPALAMTGQNTLTVTIDDSGCSYTSSINLIVHMTPLASFTLDGVSCVDSILQLLFTGNANFSSQYNWDFAGADVLPGSRPVDFFLHWNTPGDYLLSLVIDDSGCASDPFELPVQIDAPLDPPQINCLEEDFYSLVISWDPVVGASEYIVTSSIGSGKLVGNTYTISNLPDDTPVDITVTAIGGSACGQSSATIQCRTLDYVPVSTFIPTVFSPNSDGINDVFYIQSNAQITTVNAFRIFDRWGNMIFEALNFQPNDPQHGWDGTFSGKPLNPAVFLYWAEVQTIYDKPMILEGEVTLIR